MRTIERDIAGIFVFSADNRVLLGYTGVYSGKLVVPGGGVHKGETHEEAARREILEEVGIDLKDVELEKIPGSNSGVSEKTLRETGEKVKVQMQFYDYIARLDKQAKDIKISTDDDLYSAQFFSVEELHGKDIAKATRSRLVQFGFLDS